MSSTNSKKSIWSAIANLFLGKPCESGLPHRWPRLNFISGNIYCQHPACVALRHEHNLPEISTYELDGVTIQGPKDTINKIKVNTGRMHELVLAMQELETQNKMAYNKGHEKGMQMQRQKLFDTLLVSRQLLIDTLSPVGINEHRVRQFATWYETQRDARVNPKHDEVTYKTCKNIIELEVMLNEVMQDNVQLTT